MQRTLTALAAISLLALTGCAAAAPTPARAHHTPQPRQIQVYVAPHEDDEWQMWSQVENRPDVFKVFVVLGNGEQTAFCAPFPNAGYQAGLEKEPSPHPVGQFTSSCSQARLNSWTGYFTQMSQTDPTIPGDLTGPTRTRPFPGSVCRADNVPVGVDGPCTSDDTTAQVWTDREGRGVLIAWNLGEGDETVPEIDWAIRNVLNHRSDFGIPGGVVTALWGAYANADDPHCFIYQNPDHLALHAALEQFDYGTPVQGFAACGDEAGMMHAQVSDQSMDAAFEVTQDGHRVGAHTSNYGWLDVTWYPLSRHDQSDLFHGAQAFWTRGH